MLRQGRGNLQLGVHAVDAGHQNRLLVAFEFKKPAKSSETTQNLGAKGRPSLFPYQRLGFGSDINIDTGGGIGFFNRTASLRETFSCFRLPDIEFDLQPAELPEISQCQDKFTGMKGKNLRRKIIFRLGGIGVKWLVVSYEPAWLRQRFSQVFGQGKYPLVSYSVIEFQPG